MKQEDRQRRYRGRALEARVAQRLRRGGEPSALLAELQTRLGPAEAQSVLAAAQADIARRRPTLIGLRVLVYAWAALLVLQNFGVLKASAEPVREAPGPSGLADPVKLTALLAAARLVAIGLGALAHARLANVGTSIWLAAAILYGYPLQLFLDRLVTGGPRASAAALLSGYALLSYAAIAAIACIWRAGGLRRGAPDVT